MSALLAPWRGAVVVAWLAADLAVGLWFITVDRAEEQS